MSKILETKSLTKFFGGVAAVMRVNLSVDREAIHAVIGPNGAGKSTLFNLITNYLEPTNGGVFFKGQEITGDAPHKICRMGIARSFVCYACLESRCQNSFWSKQRWDKEEDTTRFDYSG